MSDVLDPAGRGAEQIASLFWILAAGALVIWILVVALTIYALRNPRQHTERTAALLIIGGGFAAPTVILAAALIGSLTLLPDLLAIPTDAMKIRVSGEQWWWRVQYELPDGRVELANEIRLPVGAPVEVVLDSPDVIHSFWIPSLAGKVDMIPGRTTRLALHPLRTGVFRGVCAEYCGASHAWMAFDVVVVTRGEFETWIEQQRRPAASAAGTRSLAHGCGACHTIRGTRARGVIGPDLTHVGSRTSLGAGVLPNEPRAFERFLARTDVVKPGVHMPAFGMLPPNEIRALAKELEALQ